MYYVYVLVSLSTGRTYTGHTNDIERRVYEHNNTNKYFTRKEKPWKLVYYEVFESRRAAMQRERFYKSGKGREKIKQLIEQSA